MSYYSANDAYHGNWTQQNHGQSNAEHSQNHSGNSTRNRQTHPQPGANSSRYPYHHNGTGGSQHSQDAPRTPYLQVAATSSGAYPVPGQANGYTGGYPSSQYSNMPPQYSQQPVAWSHAQQGSMAPGSQGMIPQQLVASPTEYPSSMLMPGGSDTGAGAGYSSPTAWSNIVSSAPESTAGHRAATARSTGSSADYVVPCPYNCGTVLTGVHAVGNMTRHLKSQNCVASGKDKTRYGCPVQGCDKRYIRSDGLRVHLRKRHNISQMPDRNGSSELEECGFEYT